jgi:predicted peroxiredoxin
VQSLRRRAWGGPQLVTQTPSQRVVHEQRLSGVAARVERLHQQPVPALAVRRALDQLTRRSFRRVELAAADRDARAAHQLERADEDLVQPASLHFDPRRVLSGQEGARGDVLRDPAGAPGAYEIALCDRTLGAVEPFRRSLEIEPRVVGERKPYLAAPVERNDLPQLRHERAQPVRPTGLAPDGVAELVARDRAASVRGEVGESKPALASGECILDPAAVDPHDEPAAELDPRLRQGFAKVTASRVDDNDAMAKLLINLTHGPEAPTRAALGFLVGRAAIDEGHEVVMFLAGDAVQLLREPVLDGLVGLGTGSLRESYDAIMQGGGCFYVSGNSSKARGFEPNGRAESALPSRLVQLALESDRVLTY